MSDVNESRAVYVVGTGRSGTSAVAGVLAQLGAALCEHMGTPSRHNPKGHFECLQFHEHTGTWDGRTPTQVERVRLGEIVEAHVQPGVYVVKDAFFAYAFRYVIPWHSLCEARVVFVHRSFDAVVKSRQVHGQMSTEAAIDEMNTRFRQLHTTIGIVQEAQIDHVHIGYNDLIENTRAVVNILATFAFDGISAPTEADAKRESAVAFIEPTLRHHV